MLKHDTQILPADVKFLAETLIHIGGIANELRSDLINAENRVDLYQANLKKTEEDLEKTRLGYMKNLRELQEKLTQVENRNANEIKMLNDDLSFTIRERKLICQELDLLKLFLEEKNLVKQATQWIAKKRRELAREKKKRDANDPNIKTQTAK